MDMNDLDEYEKKYFHVTREEMEKIKRKSGSDDWVEDDIRNMHDERESEKQHGRPSLRPQPLLQIMSLTVKPNQEEEEDNKQLALHGTILAHYFDAYKTPVAHQIYKREVPEILGIDGSLTLNGPDYSCDPYCAYLPLFKSRVDVNLLDQTNIIFARIYFFLDDDDIDIDHNYYEQVKSKVVHFQRGSLTLHYIVIPFGVHCRLDVIFPMTKEDVEKYENGIVNVNGKIVARYADTYGNCSSQECVLFEKQDTEFEQVKSGVVKLSRCWVSLPAYSPLIIEVDLSEFGSGRKIGRCTRKLLPQPGLMSEGSLLLDDMEIWAGAAWFSPDPFGRNDYKYSTSLPPILSMNVEGENQEEEWTETIRHILPQFSDEDELSNVVTVFAQWSDKDELLSSNAVEIFSVFIGQEKSKAVQIYGSIELFRHYKKLGCIFKRDENEALVLSEDLKFIPILNGSREYEYCSSLKMKFDIKDIEGCLAIKGYVNWAASTLDSDFWYEKQLCSLIQGQHGGFAAIHYSIFDKAVRVTIKVLLVVVNYEVWGSLVTQYSHYDYSSRYNKDCYRSVLFKRTQDNLVQINNDSTIPLSRSTIVVPSYSSLIVDVDLSFGISEQKICAQKIKIDIGEGFKTVETNDYLLGIELDWGMVK